MSDLFRFGVSLDKALLDKFDRYIRERNYSNRSEAFRDLIRQELIKKEWQEGDDVAGAITLIYDHHRKDLLNKITDLQHDFQSVIISTQHIHLDHDNCLEIVAFVCCLLSFWSLPSVAKPLTKDIISVTDFRGKKIEGTRPVSRIVCLIESALSGPIHAGRRG